MIKDYLKLIRVKQWTKNFFCFSGIIFGEQLISSSLFLVSLSTFICFCLISSSVYILNDLFDKDADANHPKKKKRPIASGAIQIFPALLIAITFLLLSIKISLTINLIVFTLTLIYLINNIFYNLIFKKYPIIDVLSISFGFIFRLLSGIYAVNLVPTPWIILCTLFLALFLGFSKRRAELKSFDNDFSQRPVLKYYNIDFLDSLINESALSAIIFYSLFCIISKNNLVLIATIPIVYFAMMYYKFLLFQNIHGEEPESIILKNKKIIISIILWLVSYLILNYYF
tara:strand:- start:645 stop:1499 length:855 start_codon:yes stop_codon:yes gene_type:complete